MNPPNESYADQPVPADQPAPISLGTTIESIAALFGLLGEDVALAMASFMGNVAGPGAGLKDHSGQRIEPGLNVLHATHHSSREKALLDFLKQPLRNAQKALRQRARALPPKMVERACFGFEEGPRPEGVSVVDPLWQRHLEHRDEMDKEIAGGAFCSPQDLEMPGPDHQTTLQKDRRETFHLRPTFMIEGMDLPRTAAALSEVLERQAFLFDATGVFCGDSGKRGKGRQGLLSPAGLLNGMDLPYARQSAAQGHGSLECSKVRLWSSLPSDRFIEIVTDTKSPHSTLLSHCLCWRAQRAVVKVASTPGAAQRASQTYCQAIRSIMGARAGGRGPVYELYDSEVEFHGESQALYLDWLEDLGASQHLDLSVFHDLPARLLWALLHLHEIGGETFSAETPFHLARHAVRQHVKLITEVREQAEVHRQRKLMESLLLAIERQGGACMLRELQRSLTQRKDVLVPVLDLLISKDRITLGPDRRYRLAQGAGAS